MDVKIVVGVKKIIEIKNIISQDHSFLNFRNWLQALPPFFPCTQQIALFSVFNVIGKNKILKNPTKLEEKEMWTKDF